MSDISRAKIGDPGQEAAKSTLAMAAAKATKTKSVTNIVLTTHAEAKALASHAAKMKKASRNKERLRSDILYLHSLAKKIERRTDIDEDKVQATVSKEATEALTMLKEREAFWHLMDKAAVIPPPS